MDNEKQQTEHLGSSDCSSASTECRHEYDGSYWIKYGLGWCIEQVCHKCGHREHSHFVGVK
jgi:hypothetical protein